MNTSFVVKAAFRTLGRASLRSGLAALGIVIGVAAVVTMAALGEGAKASVEATLSSIDGNRLDVNAVMPRQPPFGRRAAVPRADALTIEDFQVLRGAIGSSAIVGAQLQLTTSTVEARGQKTPVRVTGLDVNGLQIDSRTTVRGAPFGPADVRASRAVCMISEYLEDLLFSGQTSVGQSVLINDVPFMIIGVASDNRRYRDQSRADLGDASIFVPYTSLQRRLDQYVPVTITVRAENPLILSTIQQLVEQLLEQRRGSRRAEFVVSNFGASVEAYKEGSRTMARLLGAIAGISLIVGGIGIMNIMMVSVIERTREIGIRLAVGTRAGDVLRQFLVESLVLCVLGGMVGIAVGILATQLLSALNDWPTIVALDSILLAFLVSAGVGIAFGYFPARRAAALTPVLALRTE